MDKPSIKIFSLGSLLAGIFSIVFFSSLLYIGGILIWVPVLNVIYLGYAYIVTFPANIITKAIGPGIAQGNSIIIYTIFIAITAIYLFLIGVVVWKFVGHSIKRRLVEMRQGTFSRSTIIILFLLFVFFVSPILDSLQSYGMRNTISSAQKLISKREGYGYACVTIKTRTTVTSKEFGRGVNNDLQQTRDCFSASTAQNQTALPNRTFIVGGSAIESKGSTTGAWDTYEIKKGGTIITVTYQHNDPNKSMLNYLK